jgi:acyl-coenzyme A thioesterase PaaI-like protein
MSDEDPRRHQVTFSQSIIRQLLAVHGGAVVALLAYIGNAGRAFYVDDLRRAFGLFVAGILFTILATICGYFAHGSIWQERWTSAKVWELGGIGAVVLSLAAFAAGSMLAIRSMLFFE